MSTMSTANQSVHTSWFRGDIDGSYRSPQSVTSGSPPVSFVNFCPTARTDREESTVAPTSLGDTDHVDQVESALPMNSARRHDDLRSSIQLRKLPVDVLLLQEADDEEGSNLDDSVTKHNEEKDQTESRQQSLLRITCLNSNYGLRTQLMLSFGIISAVTISVVVVICISVAITSGHNVKSINQANFDSLLSGIEATSARYLAESLTPKLIPEDMVQIIYEATRDRFSGYPSVSDTDVPFFDIESRSNVYPVVGKALPLDWQFVANVNVENYNEHVQDRWHLYDQEVSTANGFYGMRGACDPSVNQSSAPTYWPNCTDANNNITSGGVDAPSTTNSLLYRKAADLVPLLKAMYEYHSEIRDLGVAFANGGAGSFVQYPHTPVNTNSTYVSIGCDWMNATNPYKPSQTIGTPEEIQRCRQNGTTVSARAYNPLERNWCRDQALNPEQVRILGPIFDAFHTGLPVVKIGRAVYDRLTYEFVGCISVSFTVEAIQQVLKESASLKKSEVSVLRFDEEGTVLASSLGTTSTTTYPAMIDELNVGLSKQYYNDIFTLVNYDGVWDPMDVRAKYETSIFQSEGYYVATYPMPPVPSEYTPGYRPDFLIVLSVATMEYFSAMQSVNANVDDQVNQLLYLSILVGAAGLGAVLMVIILMSNAITAPLRHMNRVACEIVNTFGESDKEQKRIECSVAPHGSRCTPKTELTELWKEFNKMVSSFSGSSMARSMKNSVSEIENKFTMQDEFRSLYESRSQPRFGYDVRVLATSKSGQFLHSGSNLVAKTTASTARSSLADSRGKLARRFASPLFAWIVVLIVTPLLLTTVTICTIVLYRISDKFSAGISNAQEIYVQYVLDALWLYSKRRADLASYYVSRPVRDLHVLTRYSAWLLFGGVERSQSFTELITGPEACKNFSNISDCPFQQENYVCDCRWNDRQDFKCFNYSMDTRSLQKLFFTAESHDAWPDGDRNYTSFPSVDYSPSSTAWWSDVSAVPGSNKSGTAAGYDTTYDRLRVISAVPIFQCLYNYDHQKLNAIATYVAFDADGMFFGFGGCPVTGYPDASQWVSTTENNAAKLRPDLCPLGKYGFDPRCRDWYDTGRKLFLSGNSTLWVTPPYVFASGVVIADSATAPLVDPITQEYVGQLLVDFQLEPIYAALDPAHTWLAPGGFPLLITAQPDNGGAETVIGPGFSRSEASLPATNLVLPPDYNCTSTNCALRVDRFRGILESMKRGEDGIANFTRSLADGSEETFFMGYAPVTVKQCRPLNSSDFSRGVEVSEYLVYSIGLAEPWLSLVEPFNAIEDDTTHQIHVAIGILVCIIFVSILILIYLSNVVTMSITEPMQFLLNVLRDIINRTYGDEEPPKVLHSVGSREFLILSDTIETLYRVVRLANTAFFAGDLEKAYSVLSDSLNLFRRLDNEKAIGVACNNLGNMMLTMFRTLESTKENRMCGLSRNEIVSKGFGYYMDAIELGERGYEDFHAREGWTASCLDFMQHLSNRYFNRAMFLLTVKDCHEQADELEELGLRDLQIARDMDVEIRDQGEEVGWGSTNRSEKVFEVALVRSRGHIALQEMGYPDEGDVEQILVDAFKLLKREMRRDASDLFHEIGPVGRLQQLETELMRYKLLVGEFETAAMVAIRILKEDEFTLPEAQAMALRSLIAYVDAKSHDDDSAIELLTRLEDYELVIMMATDVGDKSHGSVENEEELLAVLKSVANASKRDSFCSVSVTPQKESIRGDVTMEIF